MSSQKTKLVWLVTLMLTLGLMTVLAAGCGESKKKPKPKKVTTATDQDDKVVVEYKNAPGFNDFILQCNAMDKLADKAKKNQCIALRTISFKETSKDKMCTEIYGGPEEARVTGSVDGESVDTTFKRTNGCEIGRWDQAQKLIGAISVGAVPDVVITEEEQVLH